MLNFNIKIFPVIHRSRSLKGGDKRNGREWQLPTHIVTKVVLKKIQTTYTTVQRGKAAVSPSNRSNYWSDVGMDNRQTVSGQVLINKKMQVRWQGATVPLTPTAMLQKTSRHECWWQTNPQISPWPRLLLLCAPQCMVEVRGLHGGVYDLLTPRGLWE